jgi:hypothetical protein
LKITGTKVLDTNQLVLLVDKADAYGSPRDDHFINSHLEVPEGGFGVCALPTTPVVVSYNTEESGEFVGFTNEWGPVEGKWLINQAGVGFTVLGLLPNDRALVVRKPLVMLIGKTTTTHEADATEDISIYKGGVDTGYTVPAGNTFSEVADNEWVFLSWIDGTWRLMTQSAGGAKRGTLSGDLSNGSTATLSVTRWNGTGWVSAAENIIVHEILGTEEDIPAGAVCWVEWENSLGGWVVTATSCLDTNEDD